MIEKIEGLDESGFVRAYKLPDELCDNIIDIYNNAPEEYKKPGVVTKSGKVTASDEFKKSTDLVVSAEKEVDSPVLGAYFKYVQHCFEDYMREFGILNTEIPLGIKEGTSIQYYKPGEGYYQWHYERAFVSPACDRVAVFMTYLNDVEDGGTDFLFQKFTTTAKKGLTVIWPADWTHTHKGQISEKEEKYIITGWISWCPDINVDELSRHDTDNK